MKKSLLTALLFATIGTSFCMDDSKSNAEEFVKNHFTNLLNNFENKKSIYDKNNKYNVSKEKCQKSIVDFFNKLENQDSSNDDFDKNFILNHIATNHSVKNAIIGKAIQNLLSFSTPSTIVLENSRRSMVNSFLKTDSIADCRNKRKKFHAKLVNCRSSLESLKHCIQDSNFQQFIIQEERDGNLDDEPNFDQLNKYYNYVQANHEFKTYVTGKGGLKNNPDIDKLHQDYLESKKLPTPPSFFALHAKQLSVAAVVAAIGYYFYSQSQKTDESDDEEEEDFEDTILDETSIKNA